MESKINGWIHNLASRHHREGVLMLIWYRSRHVPERVPAWVPACQDDTEDILRPSPPQTVVTLDAS